MFSGNLKNLRDQFVWNSDSYLLSVSEQIWTVIQTKKCALQHIAVNQLVQANNNINAVIHSEKKKKTIFLNMNPTNSPKMLLLYELGQILLNMFPRHESSVVLTACWFFLSMKHAWSYREIIYRWMLPPLTWHCRLCSSPPPLTSFTPALHQINSKISPPPASCTFMVDS